MDLKLSAIALGALVMLSLPAAAGATEVQSLGANPSSDQLINALSPEPGAAPLKFRGVRALTATPAGEPEARAPAVALDIKFALNSSELTDQAKEVAKQLAIAMKSDQLAAYHFLLEGHTDSTGTRAYNLVLSNRRAEAVREYLVRVFDIPASRLAADGKGPDVPLDPSNPASPVNRRVRIVNLGQ